MNKTSHGEQWSKLCERYETARDAHFAAFAAVNAKFMLTGSGDSATNPTDDELTKFEATWQAWQEVKEQMNSFIKTNA